MGTSRSFCRFFVSGFFRFLVVVFFGFLSSSVSRLVLSTFGVSASVSFVAECLGYGTSFWLTYRPSCSTSSLTVVLWFFCCGSLPSVSCWDAVQRYFSLSVSVLLFPLLFQRDADEMVLIDPS